MKQHVTIYIACDVVLDVDAQVLKIAAESAAYLRQLAGPSNDPQVRWHVEAKGVHEVRPETTTAPQ